MVLTFVLRLLDGRRSPDALTGEIEHVPSGETRTVRSAQDLISFIDSARAAPTGGGPPPVGAGDVEAVE